MAQTQRHRDQVIQDGLEYVWNDTCCIDKKSSAELSEAINSMFRWYANSVICYAYLSDIEPFETSVLFSATVSDIIAINISDTDDYSDTASDTMAIDGS